jgi:DNA-binding NtrC family response regulator
MRSTSLLLVDDDEDSTKILSEILELKGYNVDVSQNGLNALEKMKEKKYAAIILDYVMPYLNGGEVAEKIRDVDPGVGILLITGYKEILDVSRQNDFDFILNKPVDPDQVVKALRKVISKKTAHKPSLLLVDDDEDSTKILSELLEIKGYSVDVSPNGINALERMNDKRYAAVILDYMMPYLNGDEVAEKIKEIDPGVGVLLMTGHKELLDVRKQNEFDFIFDKPVDLDQVVKALRKVISKPHNTEMKEPDTLFTRETFGVVTIVEGKVPIDRIGEFEAIFDEMKRGPQPEGLIASYLLKKRDPNNVYQIVANWNSQESVELMMSKGPPAAIVAFKRVGVEPSLPMFDILDEFKLSYNSQ